MPREDICLTLSENEDRARIPDIILTVRLFEFPILFPSGKVTRMTEEKTTRELVYETNRDVKWICRALARMEAQDLDFEARIQALERLSGGEGRRGAAALDGQRRGRRGRRRGGGGDREGAWRGVKEGIMDPFVSQEELLQKYNGHRNEKEYKLGIARN